MMKKSIFFLIAIYWYCFTYSQIKVTKFTIENGLINNKVNAIVIDKNNNKWFGTSGGVSKFDGINWKNYTDSDGLVSNNITCIAIDLQDNLWFGTPSGVSCFDGANWKTYTKSDGLVDNNVRVISPDSKGNLWFATYWSGVSKFDGKVWTTVKIPFNFFENNVISIKEDLYGNMWFGSCSQGAVCFNGTNWTHYSDSNVLNNNHISNITLDCNYNIWILGLNELYQTDGQIWKSHDYEFNYIDSIAGFCTDQSGNIWIAESSRLLKFDGKNWSNYNIEDGLPLDIYLDMAIDKEGNKWIGTENSGIARIEDGGTPPCNFFNLAIITGCVFYDTNENGLKDAGEQGLAKQMIKITPDNDYSTTNNEGNYYFLCDTGYYSIKYYYQNYWFATTTNTSYNIVVNTENHKIDSLDFGVKPKINIHDVGVTLTGGPARPGFQTLCWLEYTNWGTVTKSGYIDLTYDSLLSFVSSIPPADSHTGNILKWNYDTLASREERQISVIFKVFQNAKLGDSITYFSKITPLSPENNLANNYDTLKTIITGSYDPNDKLVFPSTGEKGYVLMNSKLTYTIRFQNTGTDTAFNIFITDTLHNSLLPETFTLLASSHPVEYRMTGKGIIGFSFNNILLPDSNVNQTGSNGYVKFSIEAQKDMTDNTVVTNKAYIYFDYNSAIVTNQTQSTFVYKIPTQIFQEIHPEDLIIYPNPSSGEIRFLLPEQNGSLYHFTLFDSQGRIIAEHDINSGSLILNQKEIKPGIYLYLLTNSSGKKYNGKLVVK